MNRFRSFSLDSVLIPNTTELRQDLNSFDVKLIAYIDSTIIAPDDVTLETTTNPAYVVGNASGLFIKSTHFSSKNYSGNLVASRNIQKCVYVDWFKTGQVFNYWFRNIQAYHREVDFDGLWTTDNEAYSDVQGEINVDSPVMTETARRLQAAA